MGCQGDGTSDDSSKARADGAKKKGKKRKKAGKKKKSGKKKETRDEPRQAESEPAAPAAPVRPKSPPKLGAWAKHFGSNHADGGNVGDGTVRPEDGKAVAVDADGNVIVVGQFRGSADFGGGKLKVAGTIDIFVAKFDRQGAHQWSRRFGGKRDDEAFGVAVDGDGSVFVTGRISGSVDFGAGAYEDSYGGYVVKLDKDGKHQWSEHLVGGRGRCVAVTSDGGVVVGGIFSDKLTIDGESSKPEDDGGGFLVKFDRAGKKQWLKVFGGSVFPEGLATQSDGSVFLLAEMSRKFDFGGGELKSAGGGDIVIVKHGAQGKHVWSKRFGAKTAEYAGGLAADPSGGVVVSGTFTQPLDFGGGALTSKGGQDAFVAKLDGRGRHVWSKGYGSKDNDSGHKVAVDANGNVAFTGSFSLTTDFGGASHNSRGEHDAFVLRLDASGTRVWSKRLGASRSDYGHGVAIDGNGSVVATGHFQGKASFTGGELSSNGGHDIFLLALPE